MSLSFEPIALSQQADYQAFFEACPQAASDYSFANLWSWADVYGLEWAFSDALVWIRQNRPEQVFWAPVGDWRQADWAALKERLFPGGQEFVRIPEALADIWTEALGEQMAAGKERDQWDYLYDARELRELRGNRFHKKKNLLNQFKKKNSYVYAEMDTEMADRAMALQDDWCTWRICESSEQLEAENRAIMKTLSAWGQLKNLFGACLFVDDLIVAYTVGEMLAADTLLVHFEKACPQYKGAYQAINQLFLSHQSEEKVRWVNREQDSGDEGLRKAKLSYNPVAFVKKYRIHLI